MFTKHKPKVAILTALLAATIGVAPALAGTLYVWSGESGAIGDNNRTNELNWLGSGYPGEGGVTTDGVVLDDTCPRNIMLQDTGDLTISSLLIGDGHSVDLDYAITVTGALEIQGMPTEEIPDVRLTVERDTSPVKQIEADWIMVNFDQLTVVTTDELSKITTQ